MIPAIILGRKNSVGFPEKNVYLVGGRPLSYYPIVAAKRAQHVDEVYVSTDCPKIKGLAAELGAKVIDRPAELCTSSALSEDAYIHAYNYIETDGRAVELLVLMFCNAPTILPATIDEGIEVLRRDESLDSAVTVSEYNMWSPLRARRIGTEGLLEPFVPLQAIGDVDSFSSDRKSQGDSYFADMGASIVRPRCLQQISAGQLPQKWMGRRIYPLVQWGGCDVDHEWQIPQVDYWLRKHGLVS
jgi:hypothetical protein